MSSKTLFLMEMNSIKSMEKLKELFYNRNIEVMLDYKYTIMLALERKDLETYMKGAKIVEQYKKRLDKLNQKEIDNIFAGFMDKEDEDRLIRNTLIEDATEEGFAKGIEKELEQGKIEGIEQGSINSKKEIARNLLKKKMNIEVISEVTGLSIEEIKVLK